MSLSATLTDNRYQVANAREKIAGYYNPASHESALGKHEQAFDRAKAECLIHLRRQIESIENMTFDTFKARV